ncbi:hypothetical protein BFJ72_g3714 [Fusarium proliferatum]|uniref:Uncharacterized protein n=1 Tax=Gibberella intermedia TaxID=948311 RepID=A0A420TUI0_GIBIN|nr:hypothetical protein BFJ72_g3714 [Fusarium proliferatum]
MAAVPPGRTFGESWSGSYHGLRVAVSYVESVPLTCAITFHLLHSSHANIPGARNTAFSTRTSDQHIQRPFIANELFRWVFSFPSMSTLICMTRKATETKSLLAVSRVQPESPHNNGL